MRFLKLEILNLASLDRQDGEVIDFEHGALADSTIFSIVGPTGSGKSTILDAICLALYNRAPRYPRRKGERNQNIEIYGSPEDGESNRLAPTDSRNILTRGRKTGYSKLTFLANNGTVYRAEWHVRFQRVRYDNAQTALFRIGTADGKLTEEAADWNALPDIIGLDYDQFLRTVLIAQGSFANFLNAKENDRYELLEKLIGGEDKLSRICEKIDEHRRGAADSLKEIQAQQAAYAKDDLSEEELAALDAQIAALEERAAKDKKELEALKQALDWYTREEKLCREQKECMAGHETALRAVEQAAGQKARLAMHDATVEPVGIYKEIKSNEVKVAERGADIKRAEEQADALKSLIAKEEEHLKTLREAARAAHDELDKQKPHINRARAVKAELKATEKIVAEKRIAATNAGQAAATAQKVLDRNMDEIGEAENNVKRTDEAQAKLDAETESQTRRLTQAVVSATDSYCRERAKADVTDVEELQKAKTAADTALSDIKAAVKVTDELNAKKDILENYAKSQEELRKRNGELASKIGNISTDGLKAELNTLRQTQTLMTSEDWTRHRQNLQDGQPCPLCGAIHHPYADKTTLAPVVSELAALIQKKETELDALTEKLGELTNEQGIVSGRLRQMEESIAAVEADVRRRSGEWADIHDRHKSWTADTGTLEKLLPTIEREAQEAKSRLDLHNAMTKRIDGLREAKDEADKRLKDYKEEADKRLKTAETARNTALTALSTAKGKTENLQAQLTEKKDALAAATASLSEAAATAARMREEMNAETGGLDPDEMEAALAESAKEADNKVVAKTEETANMTNRLGKLTGKIEADRTQLREAEEAVRLRHGELEAWLSAYNATAERDMTLEDIARLYRAADNWEQLRQELQAKDDALTKATALLEKATRDHGEHQETKPSPTREELDRRKAELEALSDAELVEAKSRRQRYDHARQQMGAMHDRKLEAEQTAGEWAAIADAIGADGRTLRKIAQCYTLRFLIAHANAEIRKFNSRYELVQVKHSLGIRVIDHDRADDIRDTTSLSGGETFIVSLGLALGLSALSSRNISFDNLFIDEGFGTLDPDTLATVIDSLAMLQSSQGKKVGVISHTDTMSERITTQIRIIKNGNSGSSHIEVYP